MFGVDVGGTKVSLGVVTLDGRLLAGRNVPSQIIADGNPAERLARLARELLTQAGELELRHACLVGPGNLTPDMAAFAPNNPHWSLSASGAALADELGVNEVALENDVNAAALAEYELGEFAGASVLLHLNVGTGFAGGAVIHGDVLRGAHELALELGYTLPRLHRTEHGAASGIAPLEQLVSGRGLADTAHARHGLDVDAAQVLNADGAQPELVALREEFLAELTAVTVNTAIAFDPVAVTFGGGVAAALTRFLPQIHTALNEFVPSPPRVNVSRIAGDGALLGAVAICFRKLGLAVPPALAEIQLRNPVHDLSNATASARS